MKPYTVYLVCSLSQVFEQRLNEIEDCSKAFDKRCSYRKTTSKIASAVVNIMFYKVLSLYPFC